MKGFRNDRWALVIPPCFATQQSAKNQAATKERVSVDALLAHEADAEHMGRVEAMIEVAIRAIRKARKLPHCKHLDPEQLDEAERVMVRGAQALLKAKGRQRETGVYGLDASDRAAIQAMDEWHGALSARGAIPRAVWIGALSDAVHNVGRIVIPSLETTQ